MSHVLAPLEPPFDPAIARALDQYPQAGDGYILRLFRVFANSRRFLTSKGPRNLLDDESPLSLREREIVILRVTANLDCEYEWGVHVKAFSRAARFTEEQIAATRIGENGSDCWSSEERLLIECVDQLCADGTIGDGVYERFQQPWDLDQQLEILALCGHYHLISFVANTSRIGNEPTAPRFPR